MDLKQLSYFVHVAELGSFTQAERSLAVAQPTLSKQIRALETELQHELFQRTGRGVNLTEAGRQLYTQAQALLGQADRMRRELIDGTGTLTGECIVGLPAGVSRAISVSLVQACQQQLPNVRLILYELRSKQVLESLGEGRIDIGLAHNPRRATAYNAKQLIDERLYLVTAVGAGTMQTNRAVSVAELAQYDFVVHSDRQTQRNLILSEIANANMEVNIVAEVGSTDAILDVVHAGFGCAVLPMSALRHRREQFALTPIVDPILYTTLALLTSKARPVSQLALRVADLIERSVAQSVLSEGVSA
jgi:LysR family nitrogen assimilation transcriptional regulator